MEQKEKTHRQPTRRLHRLYLRSNRMSRAISEYYEAVHMYLDSGDVDDLRKMSRLSLEMKKEKRKAYNSILAQERGLEL